MGKLDDARAFHRRKEYSCSRDLYEEEIERLTAEVSDLQFKIECEATISRTKIEKLEAEVETAFKAGYSTGWEIGRGHGTEFYPDDAFHEWETEERYSACDSGSPVPPKPECPPNIVFKEDEIDVIKPLDGTQSPTACEWFDDDDGWHSGCGQSWEFTYDGPTENSVKFCMFCSKPVTIAEFYECDHSWIVGAVPAEQHLIGTCAECGATRDDGREGS